MVTKHLNDKFKEPPQRWMHPKTYAVWKEAGFQSLQDIPMDNWSTELRVYDGWLKQVPPENRDKLQYQIMAIYRVQDLDGKENITYNQDVIGKDRFGDTIKTHLSHIGQYDLPIFEKRYDEDTDSKVYTGNVEEVITKFEIEYNQENLKELRANFNNKTKFYAKNLRNGKAYGPFTQAEFEKLSFSELERIGEEGRTEAEKQETANRKIEEKRSEKEEMVRPRVPIGKGIAGPSPAVYGPSDGKA